MEVVVHISRVVEYTFEAGIFLHFKPGAPGFLKLSLGERLCVCVCVCVCVYCVCVLCVCIVCVYCVCVCVCPFPRLLITSGMM